MDLPAQSKRRKNHLAQQIAKSENQGPACSGVKNIMVANVAVIKIPALIVTIALFKAAELADMIIIRR
jgi:hypothetical protein